MDSSSVIQYWGQFTWELSNRAIKLSMVPLIGFDLCYCLLLDLLQNVLKS